MRKYPLPPMRPEQVGCPNSECGASGRIGVHAHKERRSICHGCKRTCAATTGTLRSRLKQPLELVLRVVTLLASGWPIPALVAACGLAERTSAAWHDQAGQHATRVQEHVVCHATSDLGQVPADDLSTKTHAGPVWIATALTVFSRLWLWGTIGWIRAAALIRPVIAQVRAAAPPGPPILVAGDGFKAYLSAILKVFRDPRYTGKRRRPRQLVWEDRHLVQVVKQRVGRRLLSSSRRLA